MRRKYVGWVHTLRWIIERLCHARHESDLTQQPGWYRGDHATLVPMLHL